jgi:hypothetical protein
MDANAEQRARDLVHLLRRDKNCGAVLQGGKVLVPNPIAPTPSQYTPTPYGETDLRNAVELGLLEKTKATMSSGGGTKIEEFEWYRPKQQENVQR